MLGLAQALAGKGLRSAGRATLQLQQLRFLNVHEYQGAQIMSKYGVTVPPGIPAFSVDEVEAAAKKMADENGEVLCGPLNSLLPKFMSALLDDRRGAITAHPCQLGAAAVSKLISRLRFWVFSHYKHINCLACLHHDDNVSPTLCAQV